MLVAFDPMVPFIYLPMFQWGFFEQYMTGSFGDIISCDDFSGLCHFEAPCYKMSSNEVIGNFEITV